MKIEWDASRHLWVVKNIESQLIILLAEECLEPFYYDNWDCGDVYSYDRDYPLGEVVDFCIENGYKVEITIGA